MKNILLWVLFVVGVVGAVYAIPQVLKHTLNSENPTLTVISRSMYPVLNRGDLIIVKEVTPEEIEVGTVLVFRHENGLAVHRVVRFKGEKIVTKGDANTDEDNPITYDDVVGRVPTIGNTLVKVPLIGRISLLTSPGAPSQAEENVLKQVSRYVWNPMGFTLLILLPAVLLLGSLATDAISLLSPAHKRKKRRKKMAERLKRRWPHARVS